MCQEEGGKGRERKRGGGQPSALPPVLSVGPTWVSSARLCWPNSVSLPLPRCSLPRPQDPGMCYVTQRKVEVSKVMGFEMVRLPWIIRVDLV